MDLSERLPGLVNANAALVRRGRWMSCDFMIEVGEDQYLVRVRDGRLAGVDKGPFVMPSWSFAVRAPKDVWQAFWAATPAPGDNDIFALRKAGRMTLEGNLQPLMANLLYVKELLASPRGRQAAP